MGEKVFVNGGTGGVGSAVVQMARAVGARVFTTAGSEEKVQLCRQHGANVAVNYKTGDVEAALHKFGPIDVWWETLREQNLDLAVAHMAMRGRIIVMAGRESRPPLARRAVLCQGLLAARVRHVQRPARGTTQVRRGDQPLDGPRTPAPDHRQNHAPVPSRRRPPPAGRQHAAPRRHPDRQNRAHGVTTVTPGFAVAVRSSSSNLF